MGSFGRLERINDTSIRFNRGICFGIKKGLTHRTNYPSDTILVFFVYSYMRLICIITAPQRVSLPMTWKLGWVKMTKHFQAVSSGTLEVTCKAELAAQITFC